MPATSDATGGGGGGNPLGLTISTANLSSSTATAAVASSSVVSPRNDFVVSQRAADYELSRVDSLSLEEQEIMANIQELQAQLMQLRAEQEEDSDDEPPAVSLSTSTGANSQLIIVSNTLPVLLERVPHSGRWKATKTTGGLDKLMCLTGVRNDLNFLWVGWVGQHIPKHEHESVRRLLLQHNCLPVFISSDVATRHSTFSSDVLWSLFHYVSEPVALTSAAVNYHATKRFNKQDWRAYESANESFADAIAEIYNEGDAVWIHDYHLMLLPSLLRQRLPQCQIGWFLHTPFPASDVYCRLPVRAELLRGVLQSDLVGFQTFDYERHFVSTCQRLLGVECSHKGIRSAFGSTGAGSRDRFTSIGVFPIGISVEPFARAASSVPTLHRVNDLHRKFGTKRIILGVDRLDNIKGIPHKLLAMELLLQKFPEWQHNVVLIQIGISTRSGVVDSNSNYSVSTSTANAASTTANTPPASTTMASTAPPSSATVDAATDVTASPTGPTASSPPTTGRAGGSISSASSLAHDTSHHLEMSSQSYKNLLAHVNQLVGRINGTFGTLDYAPIHFIHQRVMQHEELCALYDLADVCLVTSTRDGMNLVSHEFVVCQQHFMRRKDERKKAARAATRAAFSSPTGRRSPHASTSTRPPQLNALPPMSLAGTHVPPPQISPTKILTEWEGEEGGPGVLIVSEFAGCSQSLSGALVTNPWNTEDVAVSIHQALSMCRAEREIRQQKLYRYVSSNTATAWSMQFLSDLRDAVQQNKRGSTQLPKLDVKHIVSAYRQAANRVIILDYDRTLTPQHALLPLAAVGPNFKSLLDTLSADESNTVFIVSARERKFLETWLQGVRVGVAAEDGFFYRMNLSNTREHWKTMSKFQYDAAAARTGVVDVGGYEPPPAANISGHSSRRSMSLGSISSFMASPFASNTSNNAYYPTQLFSDTSTGSVVDSATTTPTVSVDDAVLEGDNDGRDTAAWKSLVLPTMMNFSDRTPGSYIEDKESSLTWHYGDADPHFGGWQAKDLQIVLERQLIGTALEVYQGHHFVSVEHEGCTKAKVLEGILKHLSLPQQVRKKADREVDFVLCVCDATTDDQMFQTLHTLVNESKERHEKKKQQAAASRSAASGTTGATLAHPGNQRFASGQNGAASSSSSSSSSGSSGTSSAAGPASTLHRSKSVGVGRSSRTSTPTSASSLSSSRRKSDKPSRRRKTRSSRSDLGRLAEGNAEDDDLEAVRARAIDEDNKVAFSRLQKVPVRMAENVAIFTLVVGPDVQHSAGRHTSAFAVDSLGDVRKVLKKFADSSRPPLSQPQPSLKTTGTSTGSDADAGISPVMETHEEEMAAAEAATEPSEEE